MDFYLKLLYNLIIEGAFIMFKLYIFNFDISRFYSTCEEAIHEGIRTGFQFVVCDERGETVYKKVTV